MNEKEELNHLRLTLFSCFKKMFVWFLIVVAFITGWNLTSNNWSIIYPFISNIFIFAWEAFSPIKYFIQNYIYYFIGAIAFTFLWLTCTLFNLESNHFKSERLVKKLLGITIAFLLFLSFLYMDIRLTKNENVHDIVFFSICIGIMFITNYLSIKNIKNKEMDYKKSIENQKQLKLF